MSNLLRTIEHTPLVPTHATTMTFARHLTQKLVASFAAMTSVAGTTAAFLQPASNTQPASNADTATDTTDTTDTPSNTLPTPVPTTAPPDWAHPHPYSNDIAASRFLPTDEFRKTELTWDLPKLVDTWKLSDGEETWPWVWTWHNVNGPHTVYVGVDQHTLSHCTAVAAASPQNNLTLVVTHMEDIENFGHTADDFYQQRCAIIVCQPQQMDLEHKILMLRDERIICYDSLLFAK